MASGTATSTPRTIVGIGASAGGLEALTQLFRRLPANVGVAYVVVQHLSPDHKSLMAELLGRQTAMPVAYAEEGVVPRADHVYLIPPGKTLTIRDTRLHLADPAPGLHLAIDAFLVSLAGDAGPTAMAVILSGTGSDGARGCRAVKEAGGMVLVQAPGSAQFDGMPRSAIATGVVDVVLPPEDLAAELARLLRNVPPKEEPGDELAVSGEQIGRIVALLTERTGTDFSEYKQPTVGRRIERRMTINRIDDGDAYLALLQQNPREIGNLYKEMLIGVTRFFRDPEAFEAIERRVLPALVGRGDGKPIRVWSAACSTGEEAYSLAILFHEAIERLDRPVQIKIFATDIDRASVEAASLGQYPESIVADISAERLAKHFVKKGDQYQVAKHIRDMVVVAHHNLLRDPPFYRIDLISCRNLFIYLEPRTQGRLLANFHFSMVEGGFLLLGPSEVPGEAEDLFVALDPRWKLFTTRPGAALRLADRALNRIGRPAARSSSPGEVPADHDDALSDRILREVLPPSIVLTENLVVVRLVGDVNQFLSLPSGRPSLNLAKMVPHELGLAIAAGVRRACKERQVVRYQGIAAPLLAGAAESSRPPQVDLELRPFLGGSQTQGLVLVSFKPPSLGDGLAAVTVDIGEAARQRITDLEGELLATKGNLQRAIEEIENANEELQSTNEELLAANEELQSTNEELQSVNEELYTVNAELQAKIAQLTELNNDMVNFLNAGVGGTVFVDHNLCVRKFTPATTVQINLMDRDIGRPLSHISTNLVDVDLGARAREVLATLAPHRSTVSTNDGRHFDMRIIPYRTDDHQVRGVVVAFHDGPPA